ncbi:hypothetical protein B0H13DRAFT_1947191 [Mycena leptocephala]|nr:hypothetical protein B0H13DRAFT_1984158 [Mycena leptocephala]KAJ7935772.1 hypothetical protein B0H13DRAFT_1947191 [Mycena leptocephala]
MLLVVVMFFTVAVPVRMHDLVEDGAEAVFFVLLGHRRGIGLRSRRRRSNIGGVGRRVRCGGFSVRHYCAM